MAADRRSPSALTASLTVQISEAEGRLRNRRRSVRVRGATLGRMLRQRMTDPALLLWAGGLGFLLGELTRRRTPAPPPGTDGSPDAGHPLFETVLNLIQLGTWARTLFAALPGVGTRPSSPSEASVRTPEPSCRSRGAPSGEASEGRGGPPL